MESFSSLVFFSAPSLVPVQSIPNFTPKILFFPHKKFSRASMALLPFTQSFSKCIKMHLDYLDDTDGHRGTQAIIIGYTISIIYRLALLIYYPT